MSAEGFHVHGPHDHEVEHAAHTGDALAGRIAMMTAIFATIGAMYGYMAGATLTTGETQIRYLKEIERYKKEKDEIMVAAKKLEDAGKEAGERSAASMHVHHRWAQAMMLIQIAIALAAITILTRNKAIGMGAVCVGGVSIAVGALAFLHV